MKTAKTTQSGQANSPWDATGYDDRFSYVSALGGDLLSLAAVRPGDRVLDLGCGTGTLLAQLAAAGAEVSGIDADPAMITQAQALLPGADLRVADGHSFTVDQSVDLVFSNAALHWMTRYFPTVGRQATALEEAGFRVIQMEHFARPTPLTDCAQGPADWLRMFGDQLLAGFAPQEREDAIMSSARRCEPTLRTPQGWFADYWRLRFVAEKIAA
jgi:trans-aconitate methyltransferase